MMCVSTLILTFNEELNLPRCLASLSWCDDIVVLDSYSSDRTEQIANAAGVRFVQRTFDDYATQRNFGINQIDYKYPWILMIDADEIASSELIAEIESLIKNESLNVSLYRLRIKYYLMGKWIRFSSGYPTWFGRIIRKGSVFVEGSVNEHCMTEGKIGYLKNHLAHYPFNKGFHAWFEKHNRYSLMEAKNIFESQIYRANFKELLKRDPFIRRRAIKSFVYRSPGRPLIIFISMFIFRFGFLDGKPGLTYCLLRMIYEYMINCKIKELKIRQKGQIL